MHLQYIIHGFMTFMGQPLKPRTSVEYIMMSSFHMVPIIQVMDDHDLLVLKQLWRFGDPPVSEPPIYQHQERSKTEETKNRWGS